MPKVMTQDLREFIRAAVDTLAATVYEEDPSLEPPVIYLAISETAILKCVDMPPAEKLRPLLQVRYAHDAVGTLLELDEDKDRAVLDQEQRCILRGAASVLCWVLGHEGHDPFTKTLLRVAVALAAHGLSFVTEEESEREESERKESKSQTGEELMKGKTQ